MTKKTITLGIICLLLVIVITVFAFNRYDKIVSNTDSQNISSSTDTTLKTNLGRIVRNVQKNTSNNNDNNVNNNVQPDDTQNRESQILNIQYSDIQGVEPNLLSLDIYNISNEQNRPVAIMLHGGAWSAGDKANAGVVENKKEYFKGLNYIFVSVNYRLSPEYSFPDYPTDVANAVNWVHDNISKYGGDNNNLTLIGHSAGAHLAMLVTADKTYNMASVKNVILLDGAGYDIPRAIASTDKEVRTESFETAFSKDRNTQTQASPIFHIQSNMTMPRILILYVNGRQDSYQQSTDLHQKLQLYGYQSELYGIYNTSHAKINADFGLYDFEATKIATNWLRSE